MKALGLKKLLILSIVLLVGVSVSVSSYLLYLGEKAALTENILYENRALATSMATEIEIYLDEKVQGVNDLADYFNNNEVKGNDQEMANLVKSYAKAMNIKGFALAFENGDAFWSIANSTWPNHKLSADVTTKGWYQTIRRAPDVTVTEPYLASDGKNYIITIGDKMRQGLVAADIYLNFLNKLVEDTTKIPGTVSLILNQDTTLLASSSPALESGKKASDYDWFRPLANKIIGKESTTEDYQLNGNDKMLFTQQITVGDKHWYFVVATDKSIAFSKLIEARNSAIFTAAFSVVVSMLIAFLIIQILYRPILALKETIVSLSSGDGDLTQRLEVKSNDDLGQMAQGINDFIESLQTMMQEIQSATTTLQSQVGDMHEQSARNKNILLSHVAETEQVVTAIEEMNSTADSMATDAANTADLTNQANAAGDESRRIADQSQSIVSELITDVDNAVDSVGDMSEKTQGINSILEVISGIAEQTNLLALNAAIEAARAGEQGRGFAVVADEVRNLASRTKDSTEEVEAALESLLKGTDIVVKSMDDTKARCQETAESSGEMAGSLDAMSNYVNDINGLSTQIATAAEEQSSVTQELTRNMTAINDIVQELEGNGERAVQSAEDIANVNNQLSAIVNRFKL